MFRQPDHQGSRGDADLPQLTQHVTLTPGLHQGSTPGLRANRFAKKGPAAGGVMLLLDTAAQDAALARLAMADLWGVAGRMAARLAALGIHTPLALKQADARFLRERCSVVIERLVWELRGVACLDLELEPAERQTIMASRSFGQPVTAYAEMQEAVAAYIARAAEKLRRHRLVTAHLVVFIETNRFRPGDPQHNAARPVHLPVATADTARLIRAALAVLTIIWRPGFSYKKAGVVLLDLHPAGAVQGGLFEAPDTPGRQALMRAVDGLNRRYGRDVLTWASSAPRRAWKLRSAMLSPRYTTRWTKLLTVGDKG